MGFMYCDMLYKLLPSYLPRYNYRNKRGRNEGGTDAIPYQHDTPPTLPTTNIQIAQHPTTNESPSLPISNLFHSPTYLLTTLQYVSFSVATLTAHYPSPSSPFSKFPSWYLGVRTRSTSIIPVIVNLRLLNVRFWSWMVGYLHHIY